MRVNLREFLKKKIIDKLLSTIDITETHYVARARKYKISGKKFYEWLEEAITEQVIKDREVLNRTLPKKGQKTFHSWSIPWKDLAYSSRRETLSPDYIEEIKLKFYSMIKAHTQSIGKHADKWLKEAIKNKWEKDNEIIKRKQEKDTKKYNNDLSTLGLSLPTINILHREGITTVYQLKNMSRSQILRIQSISSGAIADIKRVLGILPLVNPSLLDKLQAKGVPINQISIQDLDLASTITYRLRMANLNTVLELASCTENDLINLPGIGIVWASEIKRKLNMYVRMINVSESKPKTTPPLVIETPSMPETPLLSFAEAVEKLLACGKNQRTAEIMQLRCGLYDGTPRTLSEIGQQFGITRERVRQIQNETLRRMYHPARKQFLVAIYQPFETIFQQAGGILNEKQIHERIAEVAVLGDITPQGATELMLKLFDQFEWVNDTIFASREYPFKQFDRITSIAKTQLQKQRSSIRFKDLVTKVHGIIEPTIYKAEIKIDVSFIEACLRANYHFEISEDGWCSYATFKQPSVDMTLVEPLLLPKFRTKQVELGEVGIQELRLSERAFLRLFVSKIETILELVNSTASDLLRVPGLGKATLSEIKSKLNMYLTRKLITIDSDSQGASISAIPQNGYSTLGGEILTYSLAEAITGIIAVLENERLSEIVSSYYGLDGSYPLTLNEIAQNLNTTEVDVRELHDLGLAQIFSSNNTRKTQSLGDINRLVVILFEQAGDILNEQQTLETLLKVTELGKVNPIGATRLVLVLSPQLEEIDDKLWALKGHSFEEYSRIISATIAQLEQYNNRMRFDKLAYSVYTILKASINEVGSNIRIPFIKACLRVDPRFLISNDGYCYLEK